MKFQCESSIQLRGGVMKNLILKKMILKVVQYAPVFISLFVGGCTSKLSVVTKAGKNASCNATSDNDANFCERATNLSWKDTSSTLTATATWTKSPNTKLSKQGIQFYSDVACGTKIGSEIAINDATTESYTYTATAAQSITFKVISYDTVTKKNSSECSPSKSLKSTSTTASTSTAPAITDTVPPTISSINPASTLTSTASSPIYFTISDNNTMACSSTYLSMTSSNTSIVADNSVTWAGTYPTCTASITPVTAATGSTTIQFTVRDIGGNTATSSFLFTVSSTIALGQLSNSTLDSLRYGMMPTDVMTIGSKFLILNYHRVNVYNSAPTDASQSPDLVIGRTGPEDYGIYNTATASNLGSATTMTTDGTKLIVADSSNNRVLIWNSLPTVSGAAADVVIGQPNFTSTSPNGGGSAAANVLNYPYGVAYAGGKLMIADTNNNRVLIYNSIPTVSNASADVVVGQTTLTASSSSTTSTTLYLPRDVASDGTKLFVADSANNRVLIWNTIPTSNGSAANIVLGQPSFTVMTANNGGISATTLSNPQFISVVNSKLIVGDTGNYRNLVWNSIPTTNSQAANFAIGQSNLTSQVNDTNSGSVSASTSQGSGRAFMSNGKLYIADSYTSRVGVWNSFPTNDGQAMDNVLGQQNTSQNLYYNHSKSAVSLSIQFYVTTNGTKLIVSDSINGRVLIWNTIPTSFYSQPDVVLGQTNLNTAGCQAGGVNASSMCDPQDVKIIGNALVLADSTNNRVLIWNSIPTTNYKAADLVLGQANFTSNLANGGGSRSASGFYGPTGIYSDGTRLYVVDMLNNRVLVWNSFPTVNQQAADYVLGQTSFTAGAGATTNQRLRFPSSIVSIGTKLFIADQSNNRVLGWNTIPTTTGAVADFVLGHTVMTSLLDNDGGLSASSLFTPYTLATDGTSLFVADAGNNRILTWNSINSTNAQAASSVLGQNDFVSNSVNAGGVSENSLNGPYTVAYSGGKIFIGDWNNQRLIIKNYP
jgi:hypothetical protein